MFLCFGNIFCGGCGIGKIETQFLLRLDPAAADSPRHQVLQRPFPGAAIIFCHPICQFEQGIRQGRAFILDGTDRFELIQRVCGMVRDRHHTPLPLPAFAEGDGNKGADRDPVPQFVRDQVVEMPVQGKIKQDSGNEGRIHLLSNSKNLITLIC